MSNYNQQYWDEKINSYAKESWSERATPFAKLVQQHLKHTSKILELGAGAGQDGLWFAEQGHSVTISDATDSHFSDITLRAVTNKVTLTKINLADNLPFDDNSFDLAYAHLVLHYFDNASMKRIMSEIHRILKPGGIIACLLNSQSDSEYSKDDADDNDIIVVKGIAKRFFTPKSLEQFIQDFEVLLLDDKGTTPKDEKIGNSGLVRFMGRKHA